MNVHVLAIVTGYSVLFMPVWVHYKEKQQHHPVAWHAHHIGHLRVNGHHFQNIETKMQKPCCVHGALCRKRSHTYKYFACLYIQVSYVLIYIHH